MGNAQSLKKIKQKNSCIDVNSIVKLYLVNTKLYEYIYVEVLPEVAFNLESLLKFTGWEDPTSIIYEDTETSLFSQLVYNKDVQDGYINGKLIEGIDSSMYADFDKYKLHAMFCYFTNDQEQLFAMHKQLMTNFLKDDDSWVTTFEKMIEIHSG